MIEFGLQEVVSVIHLSLVVELDNVTIDTRRIRINFSKISGGRYYVGV